MIKKFYLHVATFNKKYTEKTILTLSDSLIENRLKVKKFKSNLKVLSVLKSIQKAYTT